MLQFAESAGPALRLRSQCSGVPFCVVLASAASQACVSKVTWISEFNRDLDLNHPDLQR